MPDRACPPHLWICAGEGDHPRTRGLVRGGLGLSRTVFVLSEFPISSAGAAIAAFPTCNTFCTEWNGGSTPINPDLHYVSVTTWATCNNVDYRSDPSTFDSGIVFAEPNCPAGYNFDRGPSGYVTASSCWIHLVKVNKTKKPCDNCVGTGLMPGSGDRRARTSTTQAQVSARLLSNASITVLRILVCTGRLTTAEISVTEPQARW